MAKNTLKTVKFNDLDIALAKGIVENYLNDDGIDLESDEGCEAIPNNIAFFFQADTITTDLKSFVKRKIKGKDLTEGELSDMTLYMEKCHFSVFMYPIFERHSECDMSPLLEEFLPESLQEISECVFIPNVIDEDDSISILDVMKDLLNEGFIYVPTECAVKDYFKDYTIVAKNIPKLK